MSKVFIFYIGLTGICILQVYVSYRFICYMYLTGLKISPVEVFNRTSEIYEQVQIMTGKKSAKYFFSKSRNCRSSSP